MTQKLNTDNSLKHGRQEPLAITASAKKAGFRVPMKVLWLIKY